MTKSCNFNKSSVGNLYTASKLKASTIHDENESKLARVKSKIL